MWSIWHNPVPVQGLGKMMICGLCGLFMEFLCHFEVCRGLKDCSESFEVDVVHIRICGFLYQLTFV